MPAPKLASVFTGKSDRILSRVGVVKTAKILKEEGTGHLATCCTSSEYKDNQSGYEFDIWQSGGILRKRRRTLRLRKGGEFLTNWRTWQLLRKQFAVCSCLIIRSFVSLSISFSLLRAVSTAYR